MQVTKSISFDIIGALASSLCLVHCLLTPVLFIVKACTSSTSCCADAPIWWQVIDYFFIVVSFIAIYYATKNSSVKWVQFVLWCSWLLLLIVIVSESLEIGLFPKSFIYFPALAIVGLHFYNLKYCQCKTDNCCANNKLIQTKNINK